MKRETIEDLGATIDRGRVLIDLIDQVNEHLDRIDKIDVSRMPSGNVVIFDMHGYEQRFPAALANPTYFLSHMRSVLKQVCTDAEAELEAL